jgi:isoleucyl-tRNA synthetase
MDNVVNSIMNDLRPNLNFADEENKVIEYWEKINAFQEQLELSKDKPEYTFYDGPPFATGLPHYGHILAGTIKDTVTRYATQTGHYVERRAGWDCHGLPVEFEIDKTLGISSRTQVLEMGIDKYNAECRSIVSRYTAEWRTTMNRLGRWIDFDNDYKTMNPEFMESVWWVFKQLFEKGLVYQGFKVMPYSTFCGTPLSNFEAGQNYKDVEDPACVVSFPVVGAEDGALLLAWTTTPWTLPSNLALCVNETFDYVKIKDVKTGNIYYMMEARLSQIYPQMNGKKWKAADNAKLFQIIQKLKGAEMVGLKYVPLFNYFVERFPNAFRVISDNYVTADSGTGIVHQAPAFGEDDFRVCLKNGINDKKDVACPVDANGCFTDEVPDYVGQNVKEADEAICEKLKADGRLINKAKYLHSYPFCWRSETPLIYKTVPSWFVAVETFKDKLLANNADTYWVPNFVKEGRFHNWLADARDWAVSRNRFWGTPIPIWANEDMSEVVCIGSVAELEEKAELAKGSVSDLHRESIDDITIKGKNGAVLRRIDEVFDCWFESGSMPYAQKHYPFENKERFEKTFPAHFIAEGLDQTRGWFYTLMVLSTCLFDKPAFTNLIVNGMVLAADGKKMSKRLKNYPAPELVLSQYGADALRMYLINSPVVRAEPLKFKEEGVKGVVRDIMIPWYNAFRFMIQNAGRWQDASAGRVFRPDQSRAQKSTNAVDIWVMAEMQSLVAFVHTEMKAYRLYTVMPRLVSFLDQLTKWYVRLNRERLKGNDGDDEAFVGLSVLYEVLLTVTSVMSPFTPFFSEFLYQKLRLLHPSVGGKDKEAVGSSASVHFLQLPSVGEVDPVAEVVSQEMAALQTVVELGRKVREAKNVSLKKLVKNIIIVASKPEQMSGLVKLEGYLKSELTALTISVTDKEDAWCSYSATPNFGALGKRCGKQMPAVKQAVMALTTEQMCEFRKTGSINVAGFDLGPNDLAVTRQFAGDGDRYAHTESDDGSMVIALDLEVDESINMQYLGREFISIVQKLRKNGNLLVGDDIEVFYREVEEGSDSGSFTKALGVSDIAAAIKAKLGTVPLPLSTLPPWTKPVGTTTVTVQSTCLTVTIARPNTSVNTNALSKDYPKLAQKSVLVAAQLVGDVVEDKQDSVTMVVDGQEMKLKRGTHFFASVTEHLSSV